MAADSAEREEDGSPEIVLSGNILGSFTESKQTRDLIVNLQMSCMEPVSREVCAQRFNVMDHYQEQPHLLDPHLVPLSTHLKLRRDHRRLKASVRRHQRGVPVRDFLILKQQVLELRQKTAQQDELIARLMGTGGRCDA
ncbi:tubulin-specific chaperone D-like [Hyperolius riggenbachi]|uniref:tubulin-specific chaperone D-like n=1 Tax=Hyperolius riggenbachi TaxID=752182 RepID=UPI0035A2A457